MDIEDSTSDAAWLNKELMSRLAHARAVLQQGTLVVDAGLTPDEAEERAREFCDCFGADR